MKTTHKYLVILSFGIVVLTWLSVRVTSTEGEGDLGIQENPAAREAFRRLQLQDENGQIPPNGLKVAYEQKRAMEFLPEAWSAFLENSETEIKEDMQTGIMEGVKAGAPDRAIPWISIGPGNIGGRIRSIIIHPTASPRIIWVGGVSGGVWKTTNGGASWSTNTDTLPNLAVNCMAIDPANPNILYAGTGEGFGNIDATRGNGIFKTTDGGNTWNQMPSTNNPDFYWVNRLAISPTNPQLMLAALRIQPEGGQPYGKIARSTNGGQTWAMTTFPAPMTDVRFRPSSVTAAPQAPEIPNIPAVNCIASSYEGHVYYSSNHGVTWPAANGFPPPAGFQRVELAYSRSDSAIAYASKAGVGSSPAALCRSTDGGFSFSATSASPSANASWYNNVLWVDPFDPDTVLIGGVYMLRTRNGGQSWDEASSNSIHVDHHAIVEDPGYNGTTNKIVYGGNDGGIHRTNDILTTTPPIPSVSWTSLNNSLGVTQFYGGAGHVATGRIIGGTQDNHTLLSPVAGSQNWTKIFGFNIGGDGGFCAVDQTSDPYFYGEFTDLQICRSTDGGQSKEYIFNGPNGIPRDCGVDPVTFPCANFIAPFVLDPNNINRILGGGKSLWRSNNVREPQASLVAWAEIKQPTGSYVSAVAVAPGQSNIIWVGHNDGSVYYTTNGTATNPIWTQRNNGLPARQCTRITIGPPTQTNDPQAALTTYVTFGGFSQPNAWKSGDNGLTWTPIHNNLPAAPIYSLVVSPSNPNRLHVGTEVGVFASSTGGASWSTGLGDPNVPVLELFWMGPKLVAATHRRGMFTLGGLPTE